MKLTKRLIALLMSFMMLIGTMPLTAFAFDVKTRNTCYIDKDYGKNDITAVILTGSETELTDGWYIVNSNIEYSSDLAISGEVNIIVGADLHVNKTGDGYVADKHKMSFTGEYGIVKADENTQAKLNLYTNPAKRSQEEK